MSDQEKIESVLREAMTVPDVRLPVRTLVSILQRLLQADEEEEPTLGTARVYLHLIVNAAHRVAEDPEKWSYKGRFNEALFDFHFLRKEGDDVLGIVADLKSALMRLDETHEEHFSVESAAHFLRDVAQYGRSSIAYRFR